jgi:hypothetical protein
MRVSLSSGDVRAYKKQTGFCSFHLSTVLLVEDIGWNFPVSCVERLTVAMVLPKSTEIPFEISMNCDSDYGLDGETNPITLSLACVSHLKRVDPCLVHLIVEGQFDFGGTAPRFRHVQRGTLRRMYWRP